MSLQREEDNIRLKNPYSIREIAKTLGVNKSTAWYFLKKDECVTIGWEKLRASIWAQMQTKQQRSGKTQRYLLRDRPTHSPTSGWDPN